MPRSPQGCRPSTSPKARWYGEEGVLREGLGPRQSEEPCLLRHLWVWKKWGRDAVWDGQKLGVKNGEGGERKRKSGMLYFLSLHFTWKQVPGGKRRKGREARVVPPRAFWDHLRKWTSGDFPGGPVDKNLPCNAGDEGVIPGGGNKMLWCN